MSMLLVCTSILQQMHRASGTCILDNMGSNPGGCPGGCATNVGAMPVTRLTNSADSTISYCHVDPD